jgi:tartrate dehydratase beta subunit/fumarate hydratase class I family protein
MFEYVHVKVSWTIYLSGKITFRDQSYKSQLKVGINSNQDAPEIPKSIFKSSIFIVTFVSPKSKFDMHLF